MKTKTTTREYDNKGRLVKETVYEYEHVAPALTCVCWQPWYSTAGRTCPVHGYAAPTQVWCGTSVSSGYTFNGTSGTTDRIEIKSVA